ncbi:MAG: cytidylyltransferase domain-containing protein [Betaproteobacteria bacterium]
MITACIVQARLGSARLPAKVLLPLPNGLTVVDNVIARCLRIVGVDVVVCAIPDADDVLSDFLDSGWSSHHIKVRVVRGPEQDVLTRYALAAKDTKADVVMRITADCPLLDPETCSQMLEWFKSGAYDYVSNSWPSRSFPHGLDCEIFTAEALRTAQANESLTAEDREHVGPGIRKSMRGQSGLWKAMTDRSNERITLDTLDDYRHIYQVMLNGTHSDQRAA